jgi:phosphopantetheine adenylyltransferase
VDHTYTYNIFINREFLQDVDHTLKEYRIVPILDPFGPSIEDSTLQLIVGSQETEKGCLKVNQLRNERGLPQLDIHVIGKNIS